MRETFFYPTTNPKKKGANTMQTQTTSVARTQGDVVACAEPGCMASRRVMECEHGSSSHVSADQPLKLTKRIGSTTFTVSVHFNQSSKKSVENKLLRLMERDVENMFSSASTQNHSPESQVIMQLGVTPQVDTPSISSEVGKSA